MVCASEVPAVPANSVKSVQFKPNQKPEMIQYLELLVCL